MALPQLLLPHVAPFMLVLARIAGLFVFAPVLGSNVIPRQAKAFMAIAMAAMVYPTIPAAQQAPMHVDALSLGAAMAGEMMIGAAIGLLATIPIVSVQLGGLLMGQQIGMGLANIYNPAVDTETTIFGQMLLYVAIAVFLMMGGLDQMVLAVVKTFAHVPPAEAMLSAAPLDLLVGLVASGFELALRVAAPVLCIIFLETIAMGFMMKTMPQLNILSVGFAIKIVAGMIVLTVAVSAIQQAVGDDVADAMNAITQWAGSLGAPGG